MNHAKYVTRSGSMKAGLKMEAVSKAWREFSDDEKEIYNKQALAQGHPMVTDVI